MVPEKYKRFLLEVAKIDKVRHSGRSLYDHLCGTYDLLRAWGNPEPVCLAGLFHSIYGTKSFAHVSWPASDRDKIRKLIGDEAELLAYTFCTSDRKSFLTEGPVALREIEAANLLEQGSLSIRMKKLYESDISPLAKAALGRCYFSELGN